MADKNSGWACTHSATITSQDNSGAYIEVICYWKNQGWRYDMNGVSAWVYCGGQEWCVKSSSAIDTTGNNQASYEMGRHTFYVSKTTSSQSLSCYAKITSTSSYVSGTKSSGSTSVGISAKPSYTVSYNANGGSGAPGNQTKWYNDTMYLSSTKPTRAGHSFVQWNTASNGSGSGYNPGQAYTANSGLTLYAIWKADTYTVSYNANGGTGAPGNQTKTYGVNLTLSSTKPTRTNYNFKGWSTSAGGAVVYAAGATYTNNSAVTLYAVWELAYIKPRITNFTANRCNADGTLNDAGTYVKVVFNWATDNTVTSVWVDWTEGTNWSAQTSEQVTASGKSGSVTQVVGKNSVSTEKSYSVRIFVRDGEGDHYSYSTVISIGTTKYIIDIKSGGTGMAIGKVAENANEVDINWKTRFRNGITDTKVYDPNKTDGNDGYHARPIIREHFITVQGAGWRYIGDFYFGFQGQHAALDCYFGDGQNGNAEQNSHARIILKQGWSGNELPIGVTTRFTQNTQKSVKVKIAHMSKGSCSLYIYLPWAYSELTYVVTGSYGGFTPKNTVSTSTPTTDKESTYYYTSPLDMYPVGSIYMNWSRSKTPAELFGGTWVQMTGGFLYGSVNTSTSSEGSTGNGTGTSTTAHAITEAQMPSHKHKGLLWGGVEVITLNEGGGAGYNLKYGGGNNYQADAVQTVNTGGSQGHSHGVPYMAVMIWRRTA